MSSTTAGVTIARPRSMRAGLLAAWTILILLAASCGGLGHPVDPNHCRDAYCVGGEMSVRYRATRGTRAIDILLVVDNRVGSSPDGPKLESALDRMMGNLDWPLEIGGSAIDLHIAAVSAAAADTPVVDAQPDLEGIQPDCVATEIHRFSTGQTEEIMPACADSASGLGHCWRPERNPNPCPAGQFEFRVEPQLLACQPNYSILFALTCAVRYD